MSGASLGLEINFKQGQVVDLPRSRDSLGEATTYGLQSPLETQRCWAVVPPG